MSERHSGAAQGMRSPNNRRRGLLVGIGAAAALAGGGVAWWRSQGGSEETAEHRAALDTFWKLTLETPDGAAQALQAYRGRPLLVNFWATWCAPCVRELPRLSQFAQAHAGQVQVLGLAVDQRANVHKWLQRQPLAFPVLMAGAGGIGVTRSLGNVQGGLPFSLWLDARGEIRHRKIGELSDADLTQWMVEM